MECGLGGQNHSMAKGMAGDGMLRLVRTQRTYS